MNGLRPRLGRSISFWLSSTWPLRRVRRFPPAEPLPSTWTLSVTCPTSRLDVGSDLSLRGDDNALALEPFKSRGFGHHRVSRRNYFVEDVFAVVARGGRAGLGCAFVDKADLGAGNHALILIDDQASDHAVIGLSEQRQGG